MARQRAHAWVDMLSLGTASWQGRCLRVFVGMLALLVFATVVTVPLDLSRQWLFAGASLGISLLVMRWRGHFAGLFLMLLSVCTSMRYMVWRLTSTLGFAHWLDALLGWGLVGAEVYALLVLLLGFFQSAWPLQRKPLPMEGDVADWPSVDVFVPSYNEPLSVVRQTVLAAMKMDWPHDKFNVYVLDDGRREEFRDFCEQAGCGYFIRDNNHHAKAGNINEALARTQGELVAIFDCDHVATRSFLQVCVGWFIKDPKLAMLQTPHVFFSPDPFEKNLFTFREVPNEGELFYGLVQDGNDLWNATFFCGSCAVIRRTALESVGGIATGSVTEDALTALKMNRIGWNTAFLAIPQAAGRATESLSGHIGQRIRWARGMAQIFRTNNPLLGEGLSLPQRFCYLSASFHFFNGIPRLIFLTAPLAYLLLGAQVFQAPALVISAYAIPHIVQANMTNSYLQGGVRHSFWSEVYETVLAWYIARPTLVALIAPSKGKFNVTAKGGVNEQEFFDWNIAKPYLWLLGINVLGVLVGGFQMSRVLAHTDLALTYGFNLLWTLYNVMILGASVAVAVETRQLRNEPRVSTDLAGSVALQDGRRITCRIIDFSTGGVGVRLPESLALQINELVQVSIFRNSTMEEGVLQARVVHMRGNHLGLQFEALTLAQESELVQMTYSRADLWLPHWGASTRDSMSRALGDIAKASIYGLRVLARETVMGLWRRFAALGRRTGGGHAAATGNT